MQPSAAMNLPDRQATHEAQPPHLRPLLHSDHLGPPRLALRGRAEAPRTTGHAQVVQISTGAGGPVFTRRRQSSAARRFWKLASTTASCSGVVDSSGTGPPPVSTPRNRQDASRYRCPATRTLASVYNVAAAALLLERESRRPRRGPVSLAFRAGTKVRSAALGLDAGDARCLNGCRPRFWICGRLMLVPRSGRG